MEKDTSKPTRYPLFTVRFRPDDKELVRKIKEHYGVRTLADALRIAIRVVVHLNTFTPEKFDVKEMLAFYEEAHPGCWKIVLGGEKKK